ncbi:MAG TPA: DUF929 family protein [Acidimicrobiales bacterium]|nr:DUF929 family protein [Acidimicrobiales bacterium]
MATQKRGGTSRPGGSGRAGSARPTGGQRSAGEAAAGKGAGGAESGRPRSGANAGGGAPRRLGQQGAQGAKPAPASAAPRRLGQQPSGSRRPSQGAQRRAKRRKASSPNRLIGAGAAAVVVVALLVVVLVKVTGGNGGSTNTSADRHPASAPASLVQDLVSTPLSTQSAAGVGAQTTSPYFLVSKYKPLTGTVASGGGGGTSGGGGSSSSASGKGAAAAGATRHKTVPRVVFVGAEFCPYCAVDRYALILGLSRFGTFHDLKVTTSGSSDGDIETFSFLGSSYTSPYLTFTPYEDEDRSRQTLDAPPKDIMDLWLEQTLAAAGSEGEGGYPYANFGGKYVLADFPSGMDNTEETLGGEAGTGSGITRGQIVAGIHNPDSTYAATIGASSILSEANFVDAAVCSVDGGMPANVCTASGVKAAAAIVGKSPTLGKS